MSLVLHLPNATGGRQQSLGGDASPIDAGAAHVSAAKDGGGEVLGARVEGGSVAAYAAADDYDVVVVGAAFGGGEGGDGAAG